MARFDVLLNGVSLSRTVPDMTILDIEYNPASIENVQIDKGNGIGSVITKTGYKGASVVIYYDLSIYDPNERYRAVLAAQEWAIRGGILTTSDREWQYLKVRCINPPAVSSSLKWTDRLSMRFAAEECPFWIAEEADTVSFASTGSMKVGGIVDNAPVSATIQSGNSTATGTDITSVTVTCGNTQIKLSGMTVDKSDKILIGYDANDFLTIKTDKGVDLMEYRTGSDELLLPCGKTTTVNVVSNSAVTCTLTARGRWL